MSEDPLHVTKDAFVVRKQSPSQDVLKRRALNFLSNDLQNAVYSISSRIPDYHENEYKWSTYENEYKWSAYRYLHTDSQISSTLFDTTKIIYHQKIAVDEDDQPNNKVAFVGSSMTNEEYAYKHRFSIRDLIQWDLRNGTLDVLRGVAEYAVVCRCDLRIDTKEIDGVTHYVMTLVRECPGCESADIQLSIKN